MLFTTEIENKIHHQCKHCIKLDYRRTTVRNITENKLRQFSLFFNKDSSDMCIYINNNKNTTIYRFRPM